MTIWRISKLKERLRRNELTAQASLSYLIANVAIVAVVAGLPNFGFNDPDMFEMGVAFFHWALQAVIAAIGIALCFRANGGSVGTFFYERINALGFVLFVRFTLISLALLALLFFATLGLGPVYLAWEGVYLVLVVVSAVYWWRLVSHMRSIGRSNGV